jgi:hypothetical protein
MFSLWPEAVVLPAGAGHVQVGAAVLVGQASRPRGGGGAAPLALLRTKVRVPAASAPLAGKGLCLRCILGLFEVDVQITCLRHETPRFAPNRTPLNQPQSNPHQITLFPPLAGPVTVPACAARLQGASHRLCQVLAPQIMRGRWVQRLCAYMRPSPSSRSDGGGPTHRFSSVLVP